VKRFRQGEQHGVEAELRRYRPEPRPDFLAALKADLHEGLRRPRVVRRAALVTALTVAMLTLFATLGGIGYASSAATGAFHVSKLGKLVGISDTSHSTKASKRSNSAQTRSIVSAPAKSKGPTNNPIFGDQYRPGKGCGDKNHIHLRENECKKPPK
jgi:hypothetical protein